jgi:phage terminase large subunit-like protein
MAGRPVKLAPFQKQFVKGELAADTSVAALSIGRGNAKDALSAGLALGSLGTWDRQPRREILIAARTATRPESATSSCRRLRPVSAR